MAWIKREPTRYDSSVKFGPFRATFEPAYVRVHSEICEAYYNGTPFRTRGILSKEDFEALHSLVHDLKFVAFHIRNLQQTTPISEEEYRYRRYIDPGTIEEEGGTGPPVELVLDRLSIVRARIRDRRLRGYRLPDLELE